MEVIVKAAVEVAAEVAVEVVAQVAVKMAVEAAVAVAVAVVAGRLSCRWPLYILYTNCLSVEAVPHEAFWSIKATIKNLATLIVSRRNVPDVFAHAP